MKNLARTIFWSSLFAIFVPIVGFAQTFELPEARAGEHYRVQIPQVLRDAYRLKLDTASPDSVIPWALENGDLPPGLSVRADGVILGMPAASRDQAFAFRLRAQDPAAKDDTLVIEFVMKVKSGGLRLVKFEGPTLSPIGETAKRPPSADGGEAGKESKGAAPAAGSNGDEGEKSNISQNPFSSRNRRFIVGFEKQVPPRLRVKVNLSSISSSPPRCRGVGNVKTLNTLIKTVVSAS